MPGKLVGMVQFLYKMLRLELMSCSVFIIIVYGSSHNLKKLDIAEANSVFKENYGHFV